MELEDKIGLALQERRTRIMRPDEYGMVPKNGADIIRVLDMWRVETAELHRLDPGEPDMSDSFKTYCAEDAKKFLILQSAPLGCVLCGWMDGGRKSFVLTLLSL